MLDNKRFATLIGLLSLVFWSFNAVFTTFLHEIPTFEILSCVFTISFLIALVKIAYCNHWHRLKQPLFIWIVGVLGLYGNDVLYIMAFKNAPATHADLINYLWPLFIVLFSGLLPTEKFSWRYVFSAALGFFAIIVLISADSTNAFSTQYIYGYLLALLDAVAWAAYVLIIRYYGKMPVEMIGMFCGIGALFAMGAHVQFEPTVLPNAFQALILFIMGLTSQGLAYYFWGYASQHANIQLLSVLSYMTPVVSIALLVICGMAQFTTVLLTASIVVSLAALAASATGAELYEKLQQHVKPRTALSPVRRARLSKRLIPSWVNLRSDR